MEVTEAEWLNATFALFLMDEADRFARDDDDNPTGYEWRKVAARVACLDRLGPAMPEGVRAWVRQATAYLDREDRVASADDLFYGDRNSVYQAFRKAYSGANSELRQRLAAAQDAFRGQDYYAEEDYMLEEDETSVTYTGPEYAAESVAHCYLIRDIFGNPFHPVKLDPHWRSSTVVDFARAIYDDRAFERLPILADALMDGGCHDDAILADCRSEGPHGFRLKLHRYRSNMATREDLYNQVDLRRYALSILQNEHTTEQEPKLPDQIADAWATVLIDETKGSGGGHGRSRRITLEC
jgi:hypothetical protein